MESVSKLIIGIRAVICYLIRQVFSCLKPRRRLWKDGQDKSSSDRFMITGCKLVGEQVDNMGKGRAVFATPVNSNKDVICE